MTHQTISFIKSALRMFGYALIPISLSIMSPNSISLFYAAWVILIVSELFGVVEEIGHE